MKKLATLLGITLVVVGTAAAYLRREAAAQRTRNAETAARVSAVELARSSGSSVVPAMQGAAGVALAATVDPGMATQSAAAAAAPAGRPGSAAANPLAEAMRQLQNSPEMQEAARIMMRPQLEQQYEDLAKEMNLTPDKAGKVLDLLARRRMEQSAELLSGSDGPQDRAAREQSARAEEKREQAYQGELSALLGSSYPKWAEYDRKVQDRQRAMYTRMGQEQLRNSINASGTPLTDAQFQYLNKALEAEQERIDRETTSPQQQLQRLPETNRRLMAVASAHLNPQQLERYRQHLKQLEEFANTMDSMGAVP
jgi:hypothetical protein